MALIAAAFPRASHSQTAVINGRVTNADGQALSGVVVTVQGAEFAVATGTDGDYEMARVPFGRRTLEFRRLGYFPKKVTVEVVSETLTVDAILAPRAIRLSTIVVEGVSGAPDRLIDAPGAVDVVQPSSVELASVTGQVPLALARVPGLDLPQSGTNDFNVNARGFNTTSNRKLPVLVDGRDLSTALLGSQQWVNFPEAIEDLGRIEVIRGPASPLYGPNAFNGVINITTPAAREIVGTKLTVGGGELSTLRADLRQAGVAFRDRLGYRVSLGYSRSDDWIRSRTSKDGLDWQREYAPATSDPPDSTKADSLPLNGQTKDPVTGRALGTPDPQLIVSGSARLDYYAAESSMVTLEGGTVRVANSVAVTGVDRNQTRELWRPWARLAWKAGESGAWASFTGRTGDPSVRLGSATPTISLESVLHIEGRTSRRLGADAGRAVVGVSVQDNLLNTRGTIVGVANDDRSDLFYGAYFQLEYRVRRPLRLIGALRWDASELFPAQFSPRGAVVWTPVENHTLRLGVSRAFLTPSVLQLFTQLPTERGRLNLMGIETKLRADPIVGPALAGVPVGQLFTNSAAVPESAFGNPQLVPQSVVSYEVGYKGQIGRRVFLTIDAYDAHIQRFLTGLLPAAWAGLNPWYRPWKAPDAVPEASQAAVELAVRNALLATGRRGDSTTANGLTNLADGTTASVLSFGNVGTVDEWGVEVGGHVSLTDALSFSASYTWYDFAIRDSVPGDVLVPNTPQHKGTVSLSYAGRQVDLALDARFVAAYPWKSGVRAGEIPASQTVNASAGYRINPHLRAYVHVTNILDQQRFQFFGGSVIGRRILAGVTSTF